MALPSYGPDGGPPKPPAPAGTLALVALIVCVAAFVLGLIPLLGALVGIVGIVLVVLTARRGLATRRTYVGAGAAAIGILASTAVTLALVGLAVLPDEPGEAEPTVAAGEIDEVDSEPVVDEETTTPPVEESTTEASTPPPTTQPEPEPTEERAPAPPAAPDLSTYEELDERTLAQIVKSPDDHLARKVILHGTITQFDAATGTCIMRVDVAHAPQDKWYDYEHNSVGFAGDGETECPILDPFVADDEVQMWVTIGGSLSYDTQIGGSTTVPVYLIDAIELR